MNSVCIEKHNLDEIIHHLLFNSEIKTEELHPLMEAFMSWETEIIFLNYYILKNSMKRQLKGVEEIRKDSFIKPIYNLKDNFNITIDEFDENFIEFMISNIKNPDLNLDENLAECHNKYSNHNYESFIRS